VTLPGLLPPRRLRNQWLKRAAEAPELEWGVGNGRVFGALKAPLMLDKDRLGGLGRLDWSPHEQSPLKAGHAKEAACYWKAEKSMDAGKIVLLGFARGGSSILGQMVLRAFGSRAHDVVAHQHYQYGRALEEIPPDDLQAAFAQHAIVGVFRDTTPELVESAVGAKAICIVRDPRDCVVSWFHARRLHPGDGLYDPAETLDQYIETGDRYHEGARRIMAFLEGRDALVLRYEDVFTNPAMALRQIIEFSGLPIDRSEADAAIVDAQFAQIVVNDGSHQRLGLPYSALRSLSDRHLAILNDRYRAILDRFGYPERTADIPPVSDRSEIDALKRFVLQLAEQNHYRIVESARLRDELHQIKDALRALGRLE
jgi:hypothetical protein